MRNLTPPYTMKELFVIATACFALGAAKTFNYVSVKYDIGINGYWSLPKRFDDDNRFKFVATDDTLNVDVYSYPNDPRFFILYDHYGNIAGIRTGYIKSDLPKRAEKNGLTFEYKFDDKAIFESGTFWGIDIWYSTVLFVDPEKLKKGGRKSPKGVVAEEIYLKLEGKWTKIPTDQCQAESLGFTKQGCFPGMDDLNPGLRVIRRHGLHVMVGGRGLYVNHPPPGRAWPVRDVGWEGVAWIVGWLGSYFGGKHYFYKMSESLDCKDFQGIFLLYECGELVGLGLIPFGSFTAAPYRTWFEDPPVTAVKIIVPNRPKCLTEWVSQYGTSSLHIFFKPVPRLTSCLYPFQKWNQCPNEKKTSPSFSLFKAKYSETGDEAESVVENPIPHKMFTNLLD